MFLRPGSTRYSATSMTSQLDRMWKKRPGYGPWHRSSSPTLTEGTWPSGMAYALHSEILVLH